MQDLLSTTMLIMNQEDETRKGEKRIKNMTPGRINALGNKKENRG
jgi:hypothetical protein